jgi:hypothetical protein
LHYIQISKAFKKVSEKEFYAFLETKLDRMETRTLDKDNPHRLADTVTFCKGKYGTLLGEIWRENDLVSYWLDIELTSKL